MKSRRITKRGSMTPRLSSCRGMIPRPAYLLSQHYNRRDFPYPPCSMTYDKKKCLAGCEPRHNSLLIDPLTSLYQPPKHKPASRYP